MHYHLSTLSEFWLVGPIQLSFPTLLAPNSSYASKYNCTLIRVQKGCEWSTCFLGKFSLQCRKDKTFCERPFALHDQQPGKGFLKCWRCPPLEKFLRTPMPPDMLFLIRQ